MEKQNSQRSTLELKKNALTTPVSEKAEKAYELLDYLHGIHQDNEIFIENLHEMFVSYSLDDEAANKDQVTNSYLALRHFLRDTQKLFQERTDLSKKSIYTKAANI